MDLIWSIIAFLTIAGIAVFGLIGVRPVNKIVAYLAVTPEATAKIARAIEDELQGHDFGDHPDVFVEAELKELSKHIVGRAFSEIYRGQPFEVTKKTVFDPTVEWPKVNVIVRDNFALIRVDLGHSMMGKHAEMKAISVRIKRNGVIKLDTRRSIKDAFEERYTPPPKTAQKAIDRKGLASAPSNPAADAPPMAKPAPKKRTLS